MIIIFLYSIAALSIILGFVALLTQKIYIDKDTKQKIDFSIPLFGKIKTNYPALIFTILGFWLIYYVTDKCYPPKQINWVLEGYLISEDSIKFDEGTLYVHPSNIVNSISENPGTKGKFRIDLRVDENKSIEEAVEYISYDHDTGGSVRIDLKDELDKYNHGDMSSMINGKSSSSLNFKELMLVK
jgi:hypothetical protein